LQLLQRHYEAASTSYRTQGWNRSSADPNAAAAPHAGRLRDVARDLVRNNPYAESGLTALVDQTLRWGLVGKPKVENRRAKAAWDAWANTTACDADGRSDFAGLQKMVLRAVAQDGEVLIRRRFRRPEDNLPIPLQLQLLEADHLDTTKHGVILRGGGRIVYGVEFNALGQRVAYWLHPEHPGSTVWPSSLQSVRIPADGVLHIFKPARPGAVRGVSWFAPIILRMKDFDEFEDATLLKQKIAACLAVITTDPDGTASPLGQSDDTTTPGTDMLNPGTIINAPLGRDVTVVQPPTVREYPDYVEASLRSQAAGIGVTYEDYTGDFSGVNFSSARMSRLRIWDQVDDRRWRLMVPQFCDPVWRWAMEAAGIMGLTGGEIPQAHWTAPPMPMIEPDKEGLAYQRNIRSTIMSLSEAIRERGYDPDELFAEIAADFEKLRDLGIWSDSDPSRMTQAGQVQTTPDDEDAAAQPAPIRMIGRPR
jgi:lambda family phage portal protein